MKVYTDWLLSNRSTVDLVDRKIVSDLTDDVVKTGTPLADFSRTYTSWLKQEVFDATFWDWVSTNRSAFGFTSTQVTTLRSGFGINVDDPTNPSLSLRNFSNQGALRKLNDALDSAFGDTSTFKALVPQPIDDDAPWITGRRTALEPRSYVNGFNFESLPFTNDAPVLNAASTPAGVAVLEDSGIPVGPVGTLVSSLVDFATPAGQVDNVTDADAGALLGIAVTAAATTNGTWYYSTNNGASWSALAGVSDSSARLLAADGNTRIYFQGAANFDGQADLTFRAWDRTSGSNGGMASTVVNGGRTAFSTATDTATFDVAPVNDAPILTGIRAATIAEGGRVVIGPPNLDYSDADDFDGEVTFTVTNQVNGKIQISGSDVTSFTGVQLATGQVDFVHDGSETATARFDVSVEDGNEDGSTPVAQTFNLTVTPINDAPVLTGDLATTVAEGGSVVIGASDLGYNDNDDNDAGVTFTITNPVNGKIQVGGSDATSFTGTQLAAGQVTFAHNGSETPTTSFDVSVEDGNEDGSAPLARTFNLTVTPINDAPVLTGNLAATVAEGGRVVIGPPNLDYSDADDFDGEVTFTVTNQVNGKVQISGSDVTSFTGVQLATGQVDFVHNGSETATARFDVSVEDGNEDGSTPVTRTFNLAVTPVNDPPVAADFSVTTAEDTPIVIDVLAHVFDPDGDRLGVGTSTFTPHGRVEILDDLSLQYTPNADYFGIDTITYQATDGTTSDTATVTVTVTPVGDPPKVTELNFNSTSFGFVATDPDGDALSLSSPELDFASVFGSATVNNGSPTNLIPLAQAPFLEAGMVFVGHGSEQVLAFGITLGTETAELLGRPPLFPGEPLPPLIGIYGFGGDDILTGFTGDDVLVGGAGNDLLIGDTGADTFILGAGNDTIRDFEASNSFEGFLFSGGLDVAPSEFNARALTLTTDPAHGGYFIVKGYDDGQVVGVADIAGAGSLTFDLALRTASSGAAATFSGRFSSLDRITIESKDGLQFSGSLDVANSRDLIEVPAGIDIAALIASAVSDGQGGTMLTHGDGTLHLVGVPPIVVSNWFVVEP